MEQRITPPTAEAYAELQQAYDHFNAQLFEGQLPHCLITLQREKKTCGYFSSKRFGNMQGELTDEIALNPSYFAAVPLVETFQTLVHEMTHLWQSHFGTPGRGRYHNAEWARKMESIGLMPSSTGKPGGLRTGDAMGDYAIEGGRFVIACEMLCTSAFRLTWYDRFVAATQLDSGEKGHAMLLSEAVGGGQRPADQPGVKSNLVIHKPQAQAENQNPGANATNAIPANKSNRVKYRCACTNIWGKPGLTILCQSCNSRFQPVD